MERPREAGGGCGTTSSIRPSARSRRPEHGRPGARRTSWAPSPARLPWGRSPPRSQLAPDLQIQRRKVRGLSWVTLLAAGEPGELRAKAPGPGRWARRGTCCSRRWRGLPPGSSETSGRPHGLPWVPGSGRFAEASPELGVGRGGIAS